MEKMVVDLLIHKPDDVCGFIVNWVKEKGEAISENLKK
jgi:hypothetical protein